MQDEANSSSSLLKSLSVALHNALVLCVKCSSIRNTTQPNAPHACKVVLCHMSRCNAPSTRKVLHLSLPLPSSQLSKLSRPMNCKAVLRTCSSMTMVCNSSMKKTAALVSNSMLIIQLDGPLALRMVLTGFNVVVNLRKYVQIEFCRFPHRVIDPCSIGFQHELRSYAFMQC
jgi:hypothetical protein